MEHSGSQSRACGARCSLSAALHLAPARAVAVPHSSPVRPFGFPLVNDRDCRDPGWTANQCQATETKRKTAVARPSAARMAPIHLCSQSQRVQRAAHRQPAWERESDGRTRGGGRMRDIPLPSAAPSLRRPA
jgi:hypothetical protein